MDNVELFEFTNPKENSLPTQSKDITSPVMKDEMDLVDREGRFFIKMLKQSVFYSNGNRKQDIQELTSELENFLQKDHRDLGFFMQNDKEELTSKSAGIEQKWINLKSKFNDLKKHAMNILGDFFTVRFK